MLNMDNLTGLAVWGAAGSAKYPKFLKGSGLVKEIDTWSPGKKLKILLCGYNGARNTGADVRVAAMVDQFYEILGKDNIEINILTLDVPNIQVYFKPYTNLVPFSSIYFRDLLKACSENHIAVLSEGSCLKSKFANALTLFFCEASGIMKNQGKPCIAYGSEAGYMDPFVKKIATKLCNETYFIGRTEPSLDIIKDMGLQGHLGTDTAWTFPQADRSWVEHELKEKIGWDGKRPLIGAAVINPFCWPIKPSMARCIKAAITKNWDHHYQKWYFFSKSEEREEKYQKYINAIAASLDYFAEKYGAQILIIGMEALDFDPCHLVKSRMKTKTEVFSSKVYDGYQLAGILRSLSVLVTSRYHARVLSMPGGVPSVAVSMDERLYNLLSESGHLKDYYLSTDEENLEEKLKGALDKIWPNKGKVREEILRTIPRYLKTMAEMGKFFRGYVEKSFPGIKIKPEPTDWTGFLPPLHPGLKAILEKHGT